MVGLCAKKGGAALLPAEASSTVASPVLASLHAHCTASSGQQYQIRAVNNGGRASDGRWQTLSCARF